MLKWTRVNCLDLEVILVVHLLLKHLMSKTTVVNNLVNYSVNKKIVLIFPPLDSTPLGFIKHFQVKVE